LGTFGGISGWQTKKIRRFFLQKMFEDESIDPGCNHVDQTEVTSAFCWHMNRVNRFGEFSPFQ
jgi:hypothetical protein